MHLDTEEVRLVAGIRQSFLEVRMVRAARGAALVAIGKCEGTQGRAVVLMRDRRAVVFMCGRRTVKGAIGRHRDLQVEI